jgi:aspartate carbamoyltransferase catalytic subunit
MATLASPRHLLGLQNTPREQIVSMLRATRQMQRAMGASRGTIASAHATALMGKVVANLFFEDSTRTRLSFSVAAKRLGAEVIDLQGQTSSVSKGETLIDTATNIEAMGVSALVVRARQSGAAALIASRVRIPVLNAGDGRHEHPTQALLDAYTIAQSHEREDFDLSGLTVAIVGDVNASRVARSNIACLTTLGARVVCVGSPQLAPRGRRPGLRRLVPLHRRAQSRGSERTRPIATRRQRQRSRRRGSRWCCRGLGPRHSAPTMCCCWCSA